MHGTLGAVAANASCILVDRSDQSVFNCVLSNLLAKVKGMTSRGTKRFPISRALLLLISINTIMSLGMNLTNSLWPLYLKSLGATVLQLSYFVSMTGMIGTLVRIPSGAVSDLWGRRKIIVASILLAVFPPFLYTLSDHWQQLIPWAVIYSIAFALYMPSRMAIVADYTSKENLIRTYSIINLTWPLGSIIGPAVGGVLQSFLGWNAIFYLTTTLYAFCLLPAVLLPKPPEHGFEEPEELAAEKAKLDLGLFRSLLPFFMLNLFTGLAMGTVSTITPVYLVEKFNVATAEIGLFISLGFGVMAVLTQVPAGILAERIGRTKFMSACFALMPFLFIFWVSIENVILLLLIQMAINGLWSMTWPASASVFTEHAPRNRRGVSFGLTQAGIMLGFALGPTIGGYLWEILGRGSPYYASALFIALCVPVMHFVREKA